MNDNLNLFAGLVGLGVVVAGITGYVMNLIAIFGMNADTPLGWVIGRILGVIIPFIGGVIGYF